MVKLIRKSSRENVLWGAPRIHAELAKIGIDAAQSTVEKYMVKQRKPPSPTWKPFLKNHLDGIAAIDFFVVPTATFRVLFVFVVLSCDRRRIVHLNVTANPTAERTAQRLVNAFPDATAPDYLMRDRDAIYNKMFRERVKNIGIEDVISAARSPWQNPYVQRLIGSIRRECTDPVIVLGEKHLLRISPSTRAITTSRGRTCRLAATRPSRGRPRKRAG